MCSALLLTLLLTLPVCLRGLGIAALAAPVYSEQRFAGVTQRATLRRSPRLLAKQHVLTASWQDLTRLQRRLPTALLLCSVNRLISKQRLRRFLLGGMTLLIGFLGLQATAAATAADTGVRHWGAALLKLLPCSGESHDWLWLLLATAGIIPLVKRLKTSPIIGFLLIGLLLGPSGLHMIQNVGVVDVIAELGIVFFLFEMGLELSVQKVLSMKADVFGLGAAQFFGTAMLIAALAKVLVPGLSVGALIVFGGALSLSSSAFVLQLLKDGGQLGTRYGRASFGVLLFQDLAVVPLLVIVPLLAGTGASSSLAVALGSAFAKAIFALVFICGLGGVLLRRVFKYVKGSRSDEAFLAVTLGVVLLCSAITKGLGLSDTLGAFVGGVMVAETDYRHLVEAYIAPFRGMLLGLFFVTVGFSLDLRFLGSSWHIVLPLLLGLLALKGAVVAGAAKAYHLSGSSALQSASLLAPGGEFAFVLLGLAERLGIISNVSSRLLVTTTVLSMGLTPLLAGWSTKLASRMRRSRGKNNVRGIDPVATADISDIAKTKDGFVVLVGWNILSQTICDLLDLEGSKHIVLEEDQQKARQARLRGLPVYLADCTRREVLRHFKIDQARLVVITSPRAKSNLETDAIRTFFPEVPILVRAEDAEHQEQLQAKRGVSAVVPALISLRFGGSVLRKMGCSEETIEGVTEEQRLKASALAALDRDD